MPPYRGDQWPDTRHVRSEEVGVKQSLAPLTKVNPTIEVNAVRMTIGAAMTSTLAIRSRLPREDSSAIAAGIADNKAEEPCKNDPNAPEKGSTRSYVTHTRPVDRQLRRAQ